MWEPQDTARGFKLGCANKVSVQAWSAQASLIYNFQLADLHSVRLLGVLLLLVSHADILLVDPWIHLLASIRNKILLFVSCICVNVFVAAMGLAICLTKLGCC